MAQHLIRFDNQGIQLETNTATSIQYDKKVITMMGKARTGKSTFLNLLINYLQGDTKGIFQSNQSIEHCTHGVNMFQTRNMTLMDCQGLEYQDSHNDVDLSLFAYMVSNVMIFNCSAIDNSTLKSMEAIVSFANRIKSISSKPTLIFRVRDYGLDAPVKEMLEKTMMPHDDQYQTIRDGLKHLFDPIVAVSTLHLDRTELKQLNQEQYTEFLQQDNGYEACFDTIMTNISDATQHLTKQYLISVVQNIQNKSIDAKQLDVSLLIIKNNITEFINRIDKKSYQEILTDGSKKVYDEDIVPRMSMLKSILQQYDLEFEKVEMTLKQPYRQQIIDSIQPLIDKALSNNHIKAKTLMEQFEKFSHNALVQWIQNLIEAEHFYQCEHFDNDFEKYLQQSKDKIANDDNTQPSLIAVKNSIWQQLSHVYNNINPPTYQEYKDNTKKVWNDVTEKVKAIREQNTKKINRVIETALDHVASIDMKYIEAKLDHILTPAGAAHNSTLANYSYQDVFNIIKCECAVEFGGIVSEIQYDAIKIQNVSIITEQKQIKTIYEFNDIKRYGDLVDWTEWQNNHVIKNHYLKLKARILEIELKTNISINPVIMMNNPEYTFYHFHVETEIGKYWYLKTFKRPSKVFFKIKTNTIDIDEIQECLEDKNIDSKKLTHIFGQRSNKSTHINIIIRDSIPHNIIMESLAKKMIEEQYSIEL